jgi:outer membrane protein assembly factor BamB
MYNNLFMRSMVVLASLFAHCGVAADFGDWPAWRGPSATGNIETGIYPDRFNSQTYRWRTELPGKGCSTPIIVNRVIYLTAPVDGNDAILAFDKMGNELWRVPFGPEEPGKHRNASGGNSSPVSDGQAVYAYFKSGTLAAVRADGSVRWQQDIVKQYGKEQLFWDFGTSPVLTSRHLILVRMHDGDSWIAAFEKDSGKLAWKVDRNYETPVECDQCYTTPLVINHAGQEAILTWGAQHITVNSAADGKLLWSCGNFNPEGNKLWPAIATPVIVDRHVVVPFGRADRDAPLLFGVQLTDQGEVVHTKHAWKRQNVGTFVPTPAIYQQNILVLGDQGEVELLEPSTGKTLWKNQLSKHRNKFYASPLVAGNRVYAVREDGVVFVADISADSFELKAENDMGQSIIGSPVPMGDGILLRGEQHLFYVSGEKG